MKKRKLVLALMLSLMMLVTMIPSFSFADATGGTGSSAGSGTTSVATSGNCGAEGDGSNVTWNFDKATGTLTISGSGAMEDYSGTTYTNAPWYGQKDSINRLVFDEGVTSIGKYAFCSYSFDEVKISSTVSTIPNTTFRMNKVVKFNVAADNNTYSHDEDGVLYVNGNTLYVYPGGRADTEYTVANNVTAIAGRAFDGSQFVTKVTIPASVESIGGYAFFGSAVEEAVFSEKSALKSIGDYAFSSSQLKKIVLPEALTSLGRDAFNNTKISSIIIPAGVTEINSTTFQNCSALNSITFLSENLNLGAKLFNKSGVVALDLVKSNNLTVNTTSGNQTVNGLADGAVFYAGSKYDVLASKTSATVSLGKFPVAVTNGGYFDDGASFQAYTFAEPKKDGYKFAGWYKDSGFGDDSKIQDNCFSIDKYNRVVIGNNAYPNNETVYVYANWAESDYTVTSSVDFGSVDYGCGAIEGKVITAALKDGATAGSGELSVKTEAGSKFDAHVNSESNRITITPKTPLEAGSYSETIVVITPDGVTHNVDVTLTIDTAHNFNDAWSSDENDHWHACTVEGCTAKSDAAAHEFQWVVDKEATTTEKGSKHEECKVCGFKKKEAVEIPVIESGTTADKADTTNADNSAKTGDEMPIGMLAVLMLAAAAGIAVCGRKL